MRIPRSNNVSSLEYSPLIVYLMDLVKKETSLQLIMNIRKQKVLIQKQLSLISHPLWVTLYVFLILYGNIKLDLFM